MNLEDLYYIFLKKDPVYSYFVDKKDMKILSCPTNVLEKVYEERTLNEEDKEFEEDCKTFLNDEERYVLIPTLGPFDYLRAKRNFIREVSLETRKEISSFSDDLEGMNLFVDKITELNLLDNWKKTFQDQVDDSIYLWLVNNKINLIPENERYNKIFSFMSKIYRLNPWHYFDNQELIRLSISDFNVYINFNLNDVFFSDFTIYYGKQGLCDFEALNDFSASEENLINSFKTCVKCSFLDKNEASLDTIAIINGSKMEFKEYYPSIEQYNEGKLPTHNLDENNLILLEDVVRVLYAGLQDYIYYPIYLNRKKNEFLDIEVLENDDLVLKGYLYQKTGEINDYGFSYEEKETVCFLHEDKTYEVKLDCYHSSILDDDSPNYNYYIIAIDIDSDDVVYFDQSTYYEEEKAIPLLKNKLNKFIKRHGFAKNIYLDDYFTHQLILETVGNDVEIEVQELSYVLEDIVNKIRDMDSLIDNDEVLVLN